MLRCRTVFILPRAFPARSPTSPRPILLLRLTNRLLWPNRPGWAAIDGAGAPGAAINPGAAGAAAGGAAAAAPGTALGTGVAPGAPGNARNDATINYEVDRTISHIKDPVGQLRRMSVAVVVNYRDVDGEAQPLPEEDLRKIDELVRQAMGYSVDRGDSISVVNSQFSEDGPPAMRFWENPNYVAYAFDILKYLIIIAAGILLWRGLGRPILDNMAEEKERRELEAQEVEDNRAALEAAERRATEMSRYQENLDTARTMASQDPRAVAMVLRTWLEKRNVD